ncbi:MAG TPA: TonB-dependent receptor [Chitinophagaceae bacterium]|jgi:predicted glutamine amidotransferase|nr:TonB-dependent receptor [Chitinophagaceae bacterium]
MRKFGLLVLSFLAAASGFAQQVSGNIKDQEGKALSGSTISLLNAKDSSVVKLAVTNSDGRFSFAGIKSGGYLVSASHVGYKAGYSVHFECSGAGETTVPSLQLNKLSNELKEVTVNSKRPMVEVKADKTVLNVEGTINATGNDALELLRKAPGVTIDKDDNISLAGKNGVQIYVDGKQTPLSGADLAAYLKTLQSAQIESIELITNPSAKYEAAGNAGIINIRLKKNKSFGTNGSVSAGYNIGVYPKYNGGISLNHRNKKINIFGNYNYNRSKNTMKFQLFRDVLDTIFDGKTVMTPKNESHGFKGGLDYFINNKSTVGVLINGNIADNDFYSESRTPIIYKPTGVTNRILKASNTNIQDRNNVNFNLNYRYADTAGHELNLDADYGLFRLKSNQLQPNFYWDPTETTQLSQAIYRFISPTNIDIYTLKGDYEQNFKKGRLGVGFKTSFVNTDNNFGRYDVQQLKPELKTLDVQRSNEFDYSENINAGYVNYNKQFKGFMIQVGVRVENTKSTGDSYGLNADGSINKSSKQTFERNYTDVFPSGAITFNKNPKNQWGFSYSRRIDRPAYQDLNPFEFKLDEYTFMKGNTQLRPQYTNIISLTNTYKFKLTSTLSYSHVADIFTQLVDVDSNEQSKAFLTKKNLATQDVVNLSVSYPFQYKSYSVFTSFNGNYSKYKADLGGANRQVDLDVFAFNVFMQHSLRIGKKGWTVEASGWYNSPSIWGGTFKTNDLWSVDGGVQKALFKGKGNLKVSVSDIFYSISWRGESNFAGQRVVASGHPESRQLRTSFTWRFGSNQVKAARQRKLASEEEAKRTQGGGGVIGQ